VSKTSQPWVATLVRTIFDQPDAAEVAAQSGRVVAALAGKLPAAAAHLSDARDDLLAFTAMPREIWRQVWSSNPQERLNGELRRRTDVVGIFPGRDAIIRLAGAVLMEQNDEWTEARRYMGVEILAKIVGTAVSADAPEEVDAFRRSAHNIPKGSSRCRLLHQDHGRGPPSDSGSLEALHRLASPDTT
jgi:putative transposase